MGRIMKKNYKYMIYMCLLLFIGIFFFFFLGVKCYVLEKDSGVFMRGNVGYQYVVYPWFLKVCQRVFGEQQYLQWASNIQGLIALVTSLLTTEYFRKNFGLSYILSGIVFICTFGPYAYSLPQYVSSHIIMTEGLSFPLFYIWMLCALQIYLKKRKIWFIPLFFVTLILAYTRTQLMLFFIIDFLIILERIIFHFYQNIEINKRKVFMGVCLFGIVVGVVLGIRVFGVFVKQNIYPQMTDAVAGRVLCATEETDAELFEERKRELFLGIYDEVEKMESRQSYFRIGIRQWEDIIIATNENTKVFSIIHSYYPERNSNDVKGEMAYEILLEHWDDYLIMSGVLLLQSLVVSIFIHPEWAYLLGYIIAILLYIVAIGSVLFAKKKYHVENRFIIPMALTFLVILSISTITNIIFVGMQRYVVYPFGYFYISLIMVYVGIKEKVSSCRRTR